MTEGSISRHIVRLTVPSLGGAAAITIFNLTDTFFVSRLGTEALAAMGFTFPVVMVIGSLSIGMATGAGSLLARAMGARDNRSVNRYATDGILLAVLMVLIISIAGLLTLDPMFRTLGAEGETLELVKTYMRIWYLGSIAAIMPPVGDSAMRAMGDMVRPLVVMLVTALTNIVLDPILIFGLFGFPAMGIAGAAIATVISRTLGMITTLSFVHFRYRLLDLRYSGASELFRSWGRILAVGFPVATVRLMPHVVRGVVTSLAATIGGVHAVAAVAAGGRIESIPMIVALAVGVAIIPVVGQNWGAGRVDRVNEARQLINRTAIIFGSAMFVVFLGVATPVARIFTDEPQVVDYARRYLWALMLATMGLNLAAWTSQALTAAGKPRSVLILNVGGTAVVIIPATVLGAVVGGFTGMVAGYCAGQLVLGYIAMRLGRRHLGIAQAGTT